MRAAISARCAVLFRTICQHIVQDSPICACTIEIHVNDLWLQIRADQRRDRTLQKGTARQENGPSGHRQSQPTSDAQAELGMEQRSQHLQFRHACNPSAVFLLDVAARTCSFLSMATLASVSSFCRMA